jgi:hypothetical protein
VNGRQERTRANKNEAASGMIKRGKADKWAARGERLSAALRENLKRRKAQARSRVAGAPADDAGEAHAGIVAHTPDFRRNPGPKSNEGSDEPGSGRGG